MTTRCSRKEETYEKELYNLDVILMTSFQHYILLHVCSSDFLLFLQARLTVFVCIGEEMLDDSQVTVLYCTVLCLFFVSLLKSRLISSFGQINFGDATLS